MLKRLCVVICVSWSSTTPVSAEEYHITSPDRANSPSIHAIAKFEHQLAKETTDARLSFIPEIATDDGLLERLRNGRIDIAVVPFEAIPALEMSPLLDPFLPQNAIKMRQSLDSEVGAFQKASVERDGFRVLDFWHVSSTILGSNTPVPKAPDLQGLKVFDGFGPPDDTVRALGVRPVQIPFRKLASALQAGGIDSSSVPFDHRAQELGIAEIFPYYVDRIYRPRLYAVLVSEKRWTQIPFSDQHYLAKAAKTVGESLVGGLQDQAEDFRSRQLDRGAIFNGWTAEDVAHVRAAILQTVDKNALLDRQLVNLAFDSAAAAPPPPPDGDRLPASRVTLLFATDRIPADLTKPEIAFSSSRRLNGHTFGVATIALEDGRRFGDDLKTVSQITSLRVLEEIEFFRRCESTPALDLVVFVHGYNNAFSDSIRRGATIQEDIASNAIVISYTWPSDGELLSYGYDESSIDTAEQNFKLFMDHLTEKVSPNRISVIAHSMGSQLLIKYLAGLPERRLYPEDVKFKNIIFAAADVSTEFFRQKEEMPYYPKYPLSAYAKRITVYSSQYDRALGLSQKLHRDHRLGLANQANMYLEADISAIDASMIDPARWYQRFSFATRHSYVFDKAAGVRHLTFLLAGMNPAAQPRVIRKTRNGLDYWVLYP